MNLNVINPYTIIKTQQAEIEELMRQLEALKEQLKEADNEHLDESDNR